MREIITRRVISDTGRACHSNPIIDMNTQTVKFDTTGDTGTLFGDLVDMDWEEIDRRVEEKIGKRLRFQTDQDSRLPFRGSVFLMLKRLIFREDVQTRLDTLRPLERLR